MNISILFFIAIGLVAALLNSTAPTPLYPLYQQEFNLTSVNMTMIYGAYAGGVIISLISVGNFTKKVSDLRYVIILSLFLVLLGAAVFAFADSSLWLFIARVISGVGTGALTGAANVSLVRYGPNDSGKIAALIATLSFTIGLALGPIISSLSLQLDFYPTVFPFLFIMVFSIVSMLGICFSWSKENDKDQRSHKVENEDNDRKEGMSNLILYTKRKFFIISVSLFICWSIAASVFSLGPFIAKSLLGVNDSGIFGYVMAIYLIISGFSQIVSRKMSPERSLFYGVVTIVGSIAILFASIALQSLFLACVGLIIAGYSYGAIFVGCATLINIISPQDRHAKIVSRFYLIAYVANWVPIFLGVLVDRISLLFAVNLLFITSFLVCVIVGWYIKRTPFYLAN